MFKKYVKKILRFSLWLIGLILGIFLLIVIALHIPSIQDVVKTKVVEYLEAKINTKVSIAKIEIGLPKKIILEGFYFEDKNKDTLLAGQKLAVDISLFQLVNNKVEINSIDLKGASANIIRDTKTVFNFDYIIKAFASPEKPKDNGTPMIISVYNINLDDVKFNYSDALYKNNISVTLDHFDTQFKKFDLDAMDFNLPNAKISGLQLKLKQGITKTTPAISDTKSDKTAVKISLGKVDLSKIMIDYQDENKKVEANLQLEKLLVTFNTIDLQSKSIAIQDITLFDTNASIGTYKLQEKIVTNTMQDIPTQNWDIKVGKINIKKVGFRFDIKNTIKNTKGIDYNHLALRDFNLNGEKLQYNSKSISGNINSFSVKEQSGLNIQSFTTRFFYGEKQASLKNLYLKTPETIIKDEIVLGYPSIESLQKNPGKLQINAHLKNSLLSCKDILLLLPNLKNSIPFKNNPTAILSINTRVLGTLDNIQIPELELSGIGTTKIIASGKIRNLPDAKKAYFDIRINNLKSGAKDVNQLLTKASLPSSIALPSSFSTEGILKGTLTNFYVNLALISSYGNAKLKATFDQRNKNAEKYNALTEFDNFDLGKLIKNDSIGKISLKASVKGTGLNLKTANAIVEGTISNFVFNKYNYQNLDLHSKLSSGLFDVTASAKDPNLVFNMILKGSFRDKYPSGKLMLNVDIADLDKLHLHAGPLKLKGIIDADIQSANIDYLNGKISAHSVLIANAKQQFKLDSIIIKASSSAQKNELLVQSPFLNAAITGKYKLSKIALALQNSFAKYYDTEPNRKKIAVEEQQIAFKIDVKDSPIFSAFFPKLKSIAPSTITGRYASINDTIIMDVRIPKLIYDENIITDAIVKIETKNQELLYTLAVNNIEYKEFQIPNTSLSGMVKKNTIAYNLQLKDLQNKQRYAIGGTLKSVKENLEIILDPKNLVLNYNPWNLSEDNLIRFGKKGIYINHFDLSKAQNSISIQSESEKPNAPITIDFKNFEIETITNITTKSNLEIGGKINGNAIIKNVLQSPLFTSDLTVADFTFKKDTIGTINLKVSNQIASLYEANVAITGQDNLVNLKGNFNAINNALDFNLAIKKLNMKSIQGFTLDNLTESVGFLSGDFKITGNAKNPAIVGELQFNEIGFKAKKLNATFKSINDKIQFNNNSIAFNNFRIKDERDNDLTINGKINSSTFTDFGFDLSLDADNFKAVNSKAKDNDLYYGELFLDNHLKINGTINNPTITGSIKINKDTKFTIVLPQPDPSIADREGIVEFIDPDQTQLITTLAVNEELAQSDLKGINASVNIEVDKEAEISLVIDKANGDYLKLKGDAQLNGGIDPSGKTTLTGRYEFNEGTYEMSFNLIKRKFNIKKGSYILWTGEPTMADINITAIYKSNTAPIDLLNNQLGNLTSEVRNTYKQKIIFETQLKMKGDLMKPTITFDIVLPDGNNSVSVEIINATQAKLTQLRQQPDELNKQVFALLLLNRFIGENPFSSESGGTTTSGIARASASKILSQQLNNLAGDLINGIEIDFDLNATEDYTTGKKENKTDLNVGVSKKLLDDRLKVTVGSNIALEGPQQTNQDANTIAGDVSLDYQLSKDGRYKVRAYRLNKYQVALQGQVIETGIAFIITLDYTLFKELFQRNKIKKTDTTKN